MSNTRSFYLPDDVVEAINSMGNGSAYVTELVRRDAHRRKEHALQAESGQEQTDREAARRWAKEQVAQMKRRPADYSQVREALGIRKAA
ncbi:MAG TPA: hypothetical protein VF062_10135 [Candidatus Limnocylindrales bacterium]